jgi:hypothetical protein
MQDGSQKYHISKDKDKMKAHAHLKKEGYTKPFTVPPDPKGKMKEKGRNAHIVTKDSI